MQNLLGCKITSALILRSTLVWVSLDYLFNFTSTYKWFKEQQQEPWCSNTLAQRDATKPNDENGGIN